MHLLTLGYVAESLTISWHKHPHKTQDQPYQNIKPTYGAKSHYAKAVDESSPLSKENKKFFQEVTDTLLYYAKAMDPNMITSLGAIIAHQANPTEQIMQKLTQLLDCAATHQGYVITHQASDMVLTGHIDAS